MKAQSVTGAYPLQKAFFAIPVPWNTAHGTRNRNFIFYHHQSGSCRSIPPHRSAKPNLGAGRPARFLLRWPTKFVSPIGAIYSESNVPYRSPISTGYRQRNPNAQIAVSRGSRAASLRSRL